MGSCFLVLCLLTGLVTPGFSLSCLKCSGEDEKSCKGSSMQCPQDSDVCVATFESHNIGGQEVRQYTRSCGAQAMCAHKDTFTSSDVAVKISRSCCFTNNCNPPTPVFPPVITQKNGLSCMECTGSDGKACTSTTSRECAGNENSCVSVTFTSKQSSVAVKGCGSAGWCNRPDMNFKIGDTEQQMGFLCISGSESLQLSLLVLIFTSLLLLKVIA